MNSKVYSAGFAYGHEKGYEEAKSDKAAASWANTPQGQFAYRLAMAGSISMLASCEEKYGWKIDGDYCMPFPTYNQKGQEISMGWEIVANSRSGGIHAHILLGGLPRGNFLPRQQPYACT